MRRANAEEKRSCASKVPAREAPQERRGSESPHFFVMPATGCMSFIPQSRCHHRSRRRRPRSPRRSRWAKRPRCSPCLDRVGRNTQQMQIVRWTQPRQSTANHKKDANHTDASPTGQRVQRRQGGWRARAYRLGAAMRCQKPGEQIRRNEQRRHRTPPPLGRGAPRIEQARATQKSEEEVTQDTESDYLKNGLQKEPPVMIARTTRMQKPTPARIGCTSELVS